MLLLQSLSLFRRGKNLAEGGLLVLLLGLYDGCLGGSFGGRLRGLLQLCLQSQLELEVVKDNTEAC